MGGAVVTALADSGVRPAPGERVAITVGSRGIANIAVAAKACADWVRACGATPFLVPAMGSHGGATAAGQRQVIESYGCTEAFCGCPIRSSMEVVELPRGDSPIPVYLDAHAASADRIIVLNRVKPHTDFHGPYESGLMKMLAIGLGKQAQAVEIHRHGVYGMRELMPRVARQVLAHAPILVGVALLENAYDETMRVVALPAAEIPAREGALLAEAAAHLPRLSLDDIDLLIVDRIGKNISGVCMDTNIIGRLYVDGEPEPLRPRIGKILARALTSETHGNCLGVGLADVVTRRLADAIDWNATYENLYTSTFIRRGFLPVVMDSDAQAVAFAQRCLRAIPVEAQRIVRIQDTLHLGELEVSQPVAEALVGAAHIEDLGPLPNWFDAAGTMLPFFDRTKEEEQHP